jgi:hypothetical protein
MPTYRACVCTEGDISQHRAPVAAPVGARRGLHDHARLAVDLLLRLLQGRRRVKRACLLLEMAGIAKGWHACDRLDEAVTFPGSRVPSRLRRGRPAGHSRSRGQLCVLAPASRGRDGRGAAVSLCPLRRDFGCLHPSAPGDWQPEGLGLWKPKGLGFCHLLEQRAVFARARFAGVGGGPEK